MAEVEVSEVIGLHGTRERVRVHHLNTMTVYASGDGVWLRGGSGCVMMATEVVQLTRALAEAQMWIEEQAKRSA